jgi:hypothetical protein
MVMYSYMLQILLQLVVIYTLILRSMLKRNWIVLIVVMNGATSCALASRPASDCESLRSSTQVDA